MAKSKRLKASKQPYRVWEQKLILELVNEVWKFATVPDENVYHTLMSYVGGEYLPPEYLDRSPGQGKQLMLIREINGRIIIILTTWSDAIQGKKGKGYLGWVIMIGRNIDGKLFSFPVYDTPSFFKNMVAYARAWVDIAEQWPVYVDKYWTAYEGVQETTRGEYTLRFTAGFMNMMEFTYQDISGDPWVRTSILLINWKFSDKTMQLLKRTFGRDYEKQKRWKEKGIPPPKSRRMRRFQKRKDATLRAANQSSNKQSSDPQ